MRVLGAIGLLVGSVTAQTPIDCSSDVDGSGRVGVDDVSTAPCLSPPRSALSMQADGQEESCRGRFPRMCSGFFAQLHKPLSCPWPRSFPGSQGISAAASPCFPLAPLH